MAESKTTIGKKERGKKKKISGFFKHTRSVGANSCLILTRLVALPYSPSLLPFSSFSPLPYINPKLSLFPLPPLSSIFKEFRV